MNNIKKLSTAGVLCAVAVAGSLISFPVFGSKCAPVQHMVNIFCAVLMAFPGSMFGALICGIVYKKTHNIIATMIGEVAGTSILGGLCAYPVAIFLMGKSAAGIAFYAYIIPFFISTAMGAVISGIIVFSIKKAGLLVKIQDNLAG